MITKELQQLSDKLTGGHTSAHEISKQVDYIEKNYSGGGSGGDNLFEIGGTLDDNREHLTFDKTFQEVYDAFCAGKTCKVAWETEYATNVSIVVWASMGKTGGDDRQEILMACSSTSLIFARCTATDDYPVAYVD